ncbi:hypothetical protein NL676_013627 [Syzygium grande]|nr:hypothetical protein NL676_013627 [Syzygium grande]
MEVPEPIPSQPENQPFGLVPPDVRSYCTKALPTTAAATATTSRTPPRPPPPWVHEPAQAPVFITRNPEPSHSSCILKVPCGSDVVPSLRSFRIWLALAQVATGRALAKGREGDPRPCKNFSGVVK